MIRIIKSINEIKNEPIEIKWVHKTDHSEADQQWIYNKPDTEEMILDIKNVIDNSDDLMFKSYKDSNKNRMERIKYHLKNGGWLDLPLIGIKVKDGQCKVSFTNGRHRTMFAYENGLKEMPFLVYVDKEDEHYDEIMDFINKILLAKNKNDKKV